jgi:hypothetical protein
VVGAVLSLSAAIRAVFEDETLRALRLSPDAPAAMARFAGVIVVACLAVPGIAWGTDPGWGLMGGGVILVFVIVLNVCGIIAGMAAIDVYRSVRECLAGLTTPAAFPLQLRVVRDACLGMAVVSTLSLGGLGWGPALLVPGS